MPQLTLSRSPDTEIGPVKAWSERIQILTYPLAKPDRNPMFIERRVYQGSSGKVYPLPFYDRVAETPVDQSWDAIHLENKYLRLMILPQIGGRIHLALDKTNGYDFIYRQNVIKPALVGLAGPWLSGGIEFNWPQHHRPSTYMPCDVHIESHDDGSKTVWLSEHEPMNRMKGMHGVCLHPEKAYIELKVRLYNRTPFTQTFLWWANVATRVHEQYQSFFPPDVLFVADHAKRAMSRFPLCDDRYYGVNYGERARQGMTPNNELPRQFIPPAGMYAPNDLSWYANIPVPTSYMCMGTTEDFFGGYDHAAQAGIVHVADHHISPGKKQWTWGDHDFGYAWDRNLTDADENGIYHPYIELMAGVFTDNQPDFSYLTPGETRTFSQFWYPIKKIGPVQRANVEVAASLHIVDGIAHIGVYATASYPAATVILSSKGNALVGWTVTLSPQEPLLRTLNPPVSTAEEDLTLTVQDAHGRELIAYRPRLVAPAEVPPAATEIPAPQQIASLEELFLSGLHLQQYRHATRSPEAYWEEALRRDPLDSRCNNAMGLHHLRRGEFERATRYFRNAITRLTHRNPNPADGEPFYNLGLALRYLGQHDDAYAFFYKATWNAAWQSAAYFALAEIDCTRQDWLKAMEHLDRVLKVNADHLQARNLKAVVLEQLGMGDQAKSLLEQTLKLDRLDWSARFLSGEKITCDAQTCLDLALDYCRAGLWQIATRILENATSENQPGAGPLIHYYLAFIYDRQGDYPRSYEARQSAAAASTDYCFPARLEQIAILQSAIDASPTDSHAPYYLGNLLYDRRRYEEAIALWEQSSRADPSFATVWRNLGIAYFNVRSDVPRSIAAYDRAITCDPLDARLLYERDQLLKRVGKAPDERLLLLHKHADLIAQRDDLTLELCALYNQLGQSAKALELLSTRRFQPWEGGEGFALAQYVRAQLAQGRLEFQAGNPSHARQYFELALCPPENLGETKHLLANQSDIHYWIGEACKASGDVEVAAHSWGIAASAAGDFLGMSIRPYSEMTLYSALSLQCLGRDEEARELIAKLFQYADQLGTTPATIDYFATSLPAMLLFNDDLNQRQQIYAKLLKAHALLAAGNESAAMDLLGEILKQDPNMASASDLYTTLASLAPGKRGDMRPSNERTAS